MIGRLLSAAGIASIAGLVFCATAEAQTSAGTVAFTPPPRAAEAPDWAKLRPAPMPAISPKLFETLGKKARGDMPQGIPGVSSDSRSGNSPSAFGTANVPYTTVRVAVTNGGLSLNVPEDPVTSYPFRAAGLFITSIGGCTASMIKPGVLLTAAHCVFRYGTNNNSGFATSTTFYPANYSGSRGAAYGSFSGGQIRILSPYFAGTDTCTQRGVVCNNDIATVILGPVSDAREGASEPNTTYPGNIVGWYAYGWNGYSYVNSSILGSTTVVQITQLGYPGAFDSEQQMERTDAVGWYVTSGDLKNTQIGSAQTPGCSGGPWLANFGTQPSVSASVKLGSALTMAVIGVTSYGSTTPGYNRLGASFFGQNKEYPSSNYGGYGAGNIGKLVEDTCTANPGNC